MAFLFGAVFTLILICLLFIIRLYVVVKTGSRYKPGARGPVSVLVVAGSGGHTTEMLRLMESLSAAYSPRHYVIADTDRMSEEKICTFESSKHADSQFSISRVPRSREVHQAWISSALSTLDALRASMPLVYRLRPDVKVSIVFVESVCRVESLSLSGTLLYPLADLFFVQWSSLRDKYPKSIFLGRLV
ncbi:UDP-N-acetylglucosamine transferase subunit ALG14 [Liparis tanakae]|uniref:UDP-N-acetylglucosamine transferase subunit ALG14 n=1 Tax=Liparis tanakae TaxID=230148 RepID=A0A4Z2H8I7_9TELE|nr:UDP-N-acetylglucosamine transferase subunit ALG14 [Liparis tanakae]